MSIKILKQIREQEELAEKIRRDGLAESRRIVSTATDEAEALVDRAQSEAHALYNKTLARANDEARLDYDKIIHHAEWECHMLLDNAGKKLDRAVSIIVGKVMN